MGGRPPSSGGRGRRPERPAVPQRGRRAARRRTPPGGAGALPRGGLVTAQVPRGAVVEIVEEVDGDPEAGAGVILPTAVFVNGVDVGLMAERPVHINPGSSSHPTTV